MQNSSEALEPSPADGIVVTATSRTQDTDEFVDAMDMALESDIDDIYDANVAVFGSNDNSDDDDDDDGGCSDDEKREAVSELGLMLNATLSSEYEDANAARLNAHFFNDWNISMDMKAMELGFPDFEALLKSDYMKDYVEQAGIVKGVALYRAVCKPSSEHILRRVADCKLEEHQKAEKRKKQRLLELKNPENAENFIEGKRRILRILLDLKAYEAAVDYQKIRDEYMKRYNVSLNAAEHQRLFLNKSALKNFWRAFHREIILTNDNPIHVRLRSSDVKLPTEITEEDRLLVANMDNIELPTFAPEYHPPVQNVSHKATYNGEHIRSDIVKKNSNHVIVGEGIVYRQEESKIETKPTMDWGEEVEEDQEDQRTEEQEQRGGAFGVGNIDKVSKPVQRDPVPDKTRRKQPRRADSNEDKYTGDEESTDSTDSERSSSRRSRRKKLKPRASTLNISSISSKTQPLLQVSERDGTEEYHSRSRETRNHIEQTTQLVDGDRSKATPPMRHKSVAERSLQRSLSRSQPQHLNRSPSLPPLFDPSGRRSSAEISRMYCPPQSPPFNQQRCNENHHGTEYYRVDHCDPVMVDLSDEEEEINRIQGSYSVPSPAPNHCNRHEELGEAKSAKYYSIPSEREVRNYRKPSENGFVQQLPEGYSHRSSWGQTGTYQPNHFQRHDDDYPATVPPHSVSSSGFVVSASPHGQFKLSVGTQTDSGWLDELFSEIGYRPSRSVSELQKLAEVVELLVDIRSPNPVLLSALPEIVGSFFGRPLDPEKDQSYRTTWKALINHYCSATILIAPLPNGQEVLIKR